MDTTGVAFPFQIGSLGELSTLSGDDKIRAKILQIVLTAPGERVNMPDFGCGLRDLVFDPNNDILAATTEFAVTRALQQWAGDEIFVDQVNIAPSGGDLVIEVEYVRRDQLETGKVKIVF